MVSLRKLLNAKQPAVTYANYEKPIPDRQSLAELELRVTVCKATPDLFISLSRSCLSIASRYGALLCFTTLLQVA
jgi:hypothetical protein